MGYLGQNTAPAVTEAIDQAIKRIHAAGKVSGHDRLPMDVWKAAPQPLQESSFKVHTG